VSATTKLTIATTAGSVASSVFISVPFFDSTNGRLALVLLIPAAVTGCPVKRRKVPTRRIRLLYGLAVPLSFLANAKRMQLRQCAASGKTGTPPGAYSITVTGSSGNLQHQITVTLTVH